MAYQSLGIGSAADDGTGDSLRIGGDKINDNFVELYTLLGDATDLSSGISATSTVITLTNPVIATSITHADGVKAYYGTGNDFEIYHDGSNTRLHDTGTGNLLIQSNGTGIYLQKDASENLATFLTDGVVTLYHDNSAKIATSAAGVTVSGNILIADAGTIGSASDADSITIAADGKVTVSQNLTTSAVLTGASLVIDNIGINGNTITSSTGAINITPVSGSAIILDGTINIDAGVVTGATSITSTAFVGALTGNADTATEATNITATANNSANETVYPVFVDGATGTQGLETDTGFSWNPSTENLTIGNLLIANAGTIGSASDTNAIAISSGGLVTLSASDSLSVTGTSTFNGALTANGEIYYQGVPLSMWITTRVVGLLDQG